MSVVSIQLPKETITKITTFLTTITPNSSGTTETTTILTTTTTSGTPGNGIFLDTTGEISLFIGITVLIAGITLIFLQCSRIQKKREAKEKFENLQKLVRNDEE